MQCGVLGPRLLLLRHDSCFGPEAHAGGAFSQLPNGLGASLGPSVLRQVMQGLDFQPGKTFTFGRVPKKEKGVTQGLRSSALAEAFGALLSSSMQSAGECREPGHVRLCAMPALAGLCLLRPARGVIPEVKLNEIGTHPPSPLRLRLRRGGEPNLP